MISRIPFLQIHRRGEREVDEALSHATAVLRCIVDLDLYSRWGLGVKKGLVRNRKRALRTAPEASTNMGIGIRRS